MGPRHTSPPGHQSWAIKGHPQGDGHENQVRALDVCGNSPVGVVGQGEGHLLRTGLKKKMEQKAKKTRGGGWFPPALAGQQQSWEMTPASLRPWRAP